MAHQGGWFTNDPALAALTEHEDWVEWEGRRDWRSQIATSKVTEKQDDSPS